MLVCRPPVGIPLNEAFAGRILTDVGSSKGVLRTPP